MITNIFYDNELPLYQWYGQEPEMTDFEKWGHFSQLVWKGTTQVGCYTQACTTLLNTDAADGVRPYFTVCNYGPPGELTSQFGWHAPVDLRTQATTLASTRRTLGPPWAKRTSSCRVDRPDALSFVALGSMDAWRRSHEGGRVSTGAL